MNISHQTSNWFCSYAIECLLFIAYEVSTFQIYMGPCPILCRNFTKGIYFLRISLKKVFFEHTVSRMLSDNIIACFPFISTFTKRLRNSRLFTFFSLKAYLFEFLSTELIYLQIQVSNNGIYTMCVRFMKTNFLRGM